MLLGERAELRTLEVEHADAAILDQHRDDKLGPGIGHQAEVARVLRHVRHEDGLLVLRRPPHEPLSELDVFRRDVLAVPSGKLHVQLLRRLVD